MRKVVIVYDNTVVPNRKIQTIIGNQKYGEIVLKRETLFEKYNKIFEGEECIENVVILNSIEDKEKLIDKLSQYNDTNFMHIFSNVIYTNKEELSIIIQKACYVEENIVVKSTDTGIIIYRNLNDYKFFLQNSKMEESKYGEMESESFVNLEKYNEFLKYISGGFDARFFNSIKSNDNVVIKSSKDKEKMKKEYTYYQLLPDEMKKWMIMPYNYQESEERASYTMERLFVPDLAIRWTHLAIDEDEIRNILEKSFYYIETRKSKKVDKKKAKEVADKLYIDKLLERIKKLKQHKLYPVFDAYIKNGTSYYDIDEVVNEYLTLYNKYCKNEDELVIGHGDLCFSNMLYNNDVNLLKLIDPKGATKEEELWTDKKYDIAKLSHSVCGLYDFFNCGKYNISLDNNMKFTLKINFDNEKYKKIFKEYLGENGYDYKEIRICEISLFLSMLPLHMDYPKKVFGFLLNAINIIHEVEENESKGRTNKVN